MKCGVCNGFGDYPVIDNYGSTRSFIRCPECGGSGEEPDLRDLRPATLRRDVCEATAQTLVNKGWTVPQKAINAAVRALAKQPRGASDAELLDVIAKTFLKHARRPS